MTVHVFVGPTLPGARVLAIVGGARVHPPVVHGDLLALDVDANDVVVIVDGGYHHTGAVRHKEILALLAAGVPVVGCSSMGALRAAELDRYGMVGNGAVYDAYRTGVIDADDEVAVAHGDGPGYRRFSEPLVTIRHAVGAAGRAGLVSAAEAAAIVGHARALPYTARTWRGLASGPAPEAVRRVQDFLAANPGHADVKAADAIDTLARLADLAGWPGGHDTAWRHSTDWKHRYLYEWTADFGGCQEGDVRVGSGAMVRYRQLYDDGFPGRWRRFALRDMLSSHAIPVGGLTTAQIEDRAVALAAELGLTGDSLTGTQVAEWLRDGERDLPARERLCRVLVRSYRPARGVDDLLTGVPDLVRDADVRTAVAEAQVVNATVAGWGPARSVNHIKEAVLHRHLADVWRLGDVDDRELTAAARDRGFTTLRRAATAARPFFLRHCVRAASAQRRAAGP